MQESDLKDLQNKLGENILEKLWRSNESQFVRTEKQEEIIKQSVAEEFKRMTDEEKIMSLTEDEVNLLIKFREWGRSPNSASGVFHWRKQYGK